MNCNKSFCRNALLFVFAFVLPCSFALADETADRLAELHSAIGRHEWFLRDASSRLTPPVSQKTQLSEFQNAVQVVKNAVEAKKSNEDIEAAFNAAEVKLHVIEATVRREGLAICLLEQLSASRDTLGLVKDESAREKFAASLNEIEAGVKNLFVAGVTNETIDKNITALHDKLRAVQNEIYTATGWLPGVSSVSFGRFGFNLTDGLQCDTVAFDSIQKTQEDIELGRVAYDERKISTLGCDMSFPETSVNLSVSPRGVEKVTARCAGVNWIGKTISLSSPEHPNLGTVQTTLQRVATRFAFTSPAVDCPLRKIDAKNSSVQYLSPAGWQTVELSSKATIEGKDLQKSWILLDLVDGAPTRPGKQGQHILVVMQFQKRPGQIVVSPETLTVVGGGGALGNLWLFRPMGILRPKEVKITQPLVRKIDGLAQMNLAWPTECDELFNVDPAGQFVHIRDEVKFDMLEDDWGTKPLIATAVPNILMLAKRYDVPGVSITEPVKDWNAPGNSGPFGTVEGATLNYTIPIPPLDHHAFFMVDSPDQKQWAQRINDSVVYYGKPGGGTVDVAFRGIAFWRPGWEYLNAKNQEIVKKASTLTAELLQPANYWKRVKWRMVPLTNRWYCYDYPGHFYREGWVCDITWANALTYYGLDMWATYEGHWKELDRAWDQEIWPMTEYPVKAHDWSWMTDSVTETGEGTAIDCLAASHAGLVALTRMARTLNRPVDAATAAYLCAKTALTHTMRFAFLEFIQKNNMWHDDSVGKGTINGFHETNAYIHPAHAAPWWGVCSLSGFAVEPENYDAMFAYLKPKYIRAWWNMVKSMYPEWYNKNKPYPAGTIYGGNSNFITMPAIYLEYRLGASDATLEKYIDAAGTWDGSEQNPIVYGEIANRACPVQIASWARCTYEHAKYNPATRTASVTFTNPTKTPQAVTFRCEAYPASVRMDGKAVQSEKSTGQWKQKCLTLPVGPGKHVVEMLLPEK